MGQGPWQTPATSLQDWESSLAMDTPKSHFPQSFLHTGSSQSQPPNQLQLSSIRREPQKGSRQGWLSPAPPALSKGHPKPTILEDGAMARLCPILEQPPPSPTGRGGPTPRQTSPVPAPSLPAGSVQDLLQLVLLTELAGEGQAGEGLHPAPVHGVHVEPHHQ